MTHILAAALVLQISNFSGAPPAIVRAAQEEVTRVYADIGVPLEWSEPSDTFADRPAAIRIVLLPYRPAICGTTRTRSWAHRALRRSTRRQCPDRSPVRLPHGPPMVASWNGRRTIFPYARPQWSHSDFLSGTGVQRMTAASASSAGIAAAATGRARMASNTSVGGSARTSSRSRSDNSAISASIESNTYRQPRRSSAGNNSEYHPCSATPRPNTTAIDSATANASIIIRLLQAW